MEGEGKAKEEEGQGKNPWVGAPSDSQ